jgi:uncharacterized membrane protein YgaE (UPF0421/DUF939 family)
MFKNMNLYNNFIINIKDRIFLLYLLKCMIGASICFIIYTIFPGHQLYWGLVSVLLVLTPDHRDSLKASFYRIEANVIGAAVGLSFFLIFTINLPVLLLAIICTILICTLLRLGPATRTALAALIIVIIQEKERNNYRIAFERMASVIIGCLIAVLLTVIFLKLFKNTK